MTEVEWLSGSDPTALLRFLHDRDQTWPGRLLAVLGLARDRGVLMSFMVGGVVQSAPVPRCRHK